MSTPTTSSARKHHNRNNSNSSPTSTPIFKSLLKTNWKRRFNTTRTPCRFASKTPSSSAPPEQPHFVSTSENVVLLDWWLIKVQIEGSTSPNAFRFGVGGNAFDGRASTYFCSGEIVKRHDEMTVETVEGITITLSSLLNRFRTLENGFPSQVCDRFFLGFPFDWEEIGAQYFDGQSIHGACSSKVTRMSPDDIDDPRGLLSSFDDIPVTRLFDHMMVSSGDYNECPLTRSVFDDILSMYGNSSVKLNDEDTDQIIAEDSSPNETRTPLHVRGKNNMPLVAKHCSVNEAFKDQPEDEYDNVILDDMPMGTTHNFPAIHSKAQTLNIDDLSGSIQHLRLTSQSKMAAEDVRDLSKSVLTRSKTRLKTLTNYQQEGLPLNTTTYSDTTQRNSERQYGDTTTVTNVASVSQSAIPNVENIKVDTVLDSSSSEKCTTPKHLGHDVATGGTISEISISSQGLKVSSTTLDPGVTALISAPEVSGNHSRVSQIGMECGTLHQFRSEKYSRNLNNTSSGLLTRSQASGVLTRSRARLKKLTTDAKDSTAEPDVKAEEHAVHLVQTTKISDSCPTSEAEKSEKDESSRHVRSRARLKKLRTDAKDSTAEPDVTAEECAVHLAQNTKISDSCPTSEAEKSEKDESSRHVPEKVARVNNRHLDRPEVRRSGRKRNVVHYHGR